MARVHGQVDVPATPAPPHALHVVEFSAVETVPAGQGVHAPLTALRTHPGRHAHPAAEVVRLPAMDVLPTGQAAQPGTAP